MPGVEYLLGVRGKRFNIPKILDSATGVTDTPIELMAGVADLYRVVDVIWIDADSIPTKLDFSIPTIDLLNGTYTMFTVDDAGVLGPDSLELVVDWIAPNPRTNHFLGVIKPSNMVIGPTTVGGVTKYTHTVSIDGENATVGDNYTGTAAVGLQFNFIGREIPAETFELGL